MYQYKAVLKSTKETIANGHSIDDIEKQIIHFKREQKHGLHTNMNDKIEIFHVKRDQLHGDGKDVLIKTV